MRQAAAGKACCGRQGGILMQMKREALSERTERSMNYGIITGGFSIRVFKTCCLFSGYSAGGKF